MSDYAEYFFGSKASVVELELIEISNPSFSQVYRIVRNAKNGVFVIHEDSEYCEYVYYPVSLSLDGPKDDLEVTLKVTFGDLGTIIPDELDRVREAGEENEDAGFKVYAICKYRSYRSDDLTEPMVGPLVLEIKKFNMTSSGATFEATAPKLNGSRTGEKYNPARFQMMYGMT